MRGGREGGRRHHTFTVSYLWRVARLAHEVHLELLLSQQLADCRSHRLERVDRRDTHHRLVQGAHLQGSGVERGSEYDTFDQRW